MQSLVDNFGASYRVIPGQIGQDPDLWRKRLYNNKVLVLKGLAGITKSELWSIQECFGTPWTAEEYRDSNEKVSSTGHGSEVVTEYGNLITKAIGNQSMPWHRDIPWHREKRYPIRSLYAVTLTDGAGKTGTQFCDCDILTSRLQDTDYARLTETRLIIQNWYEVQAGKAPQLKTIPLVETHPVTGRQSVLLNSFRQSLLSPKVNNTRRFATVDKGSWIIGVSIKDQTLPTVESIEWLEYLHAVAATKDNIYEHQWEVGDLVLFDNFSGVFHRRDAVNAPEGAERRFWRMNLKHRT